ncbi:ThiF family adenylyltransferase, partial [Cellulomonas bogoriensis]|uniref:ThiF family adenylyltransferase n=1 Tax=Cellulomonas bogoriensis TaxID=301388 RepID=UPI000A0369C2
MSGAQGPGHGGARLAPVVAPGPQLTREQTRRYARHLTLPGVGVEGQRRLAAGRVLVVGAGGLGSPALQYLAAAGVGTVGVVDDDVVEESNLQRQVVHRTQDVGVPKVDSAARAVGELNPQVRVHRHRLRLDAGNALEVMAGYDVVLDGADNFPTRYLIADAAEVLGIPVVWAAIYRYTAQVAVFWSAPRPAPGHGPVEPVTYRDVFPTPPPPGSAPDCTTGGVLGAMCGTVGSVMATEAVKLLTGAGTTLLGRLAVYDALDLTWRRLTVRRDPARTPVTVLPQGPDAYAVLCGLPTGGTDEEAAPATTGGAADLLAGGADVRAADLDALLSARDQGAVEFELVDVREEWEADLTPLPGARLVPSGRFLTAGHDLPLPQGRPVLVVCAAGGRSAAA